jgi:membrane protein DedA with SNARE-associated domain
MIAAVLLSQFIDGATASALLLPFAIIVGTLILEDPTVVLVGVLASDGVISLPVALGSIYAGVVLGDIAFFSLGRYAATHPRFAQYVDHKYVVPIRTWLETRYILTVFSARFIPGSRLPTFAASGFIGAPFSTFFLTAIVGTSIWTTILFILSYWYGSVTGEWLAGERWTIALVFVVVLFVVGRHNLMNAWRARQAPTP